MASSVHLQCDGDDPHESELRDLMEPSETAILTACFDRRFLHIQQKGGTRPLNHISTWITLPGGCLCSIPLCIGTYHLYAATETRHIAPVLQDVPMTGKTAGFRSPSSGEREPATETVRSAQGTSAVLSVGRTVYDRPQFPYANWPQCGPEWG